MPSMKVRRARGRFSGKVEEAHRPNHINSNYNLLRDSSTDAHPRTDLAGGRRHTLRVSTQFVILDGCIERNQTGETLGDLNVDDFLLQEDGLARRLTYLTQERLLLPVVFYSTSQRAFRPLLKPLAAGTRQVLNHRKPEDQVGIMGFSSRTILLQDFTNVRSLAAVAVAKASEIKDQDGTFIHEDRYEAIERTFKSTVP